jgi:HAD superfamily hydrolase (TIGR01457 family)
MQAEALARLRYVMLDMDGTVYLGDALLDGAADCIEYLRSTNRRVLFFTNNPSRDAKSYADKLSALGIPTTPDEVLTSGGATAKYLSTQTEYRRVFVIGTTSFENELTDAGLTIVDQAPDAVVLAFDTGLTYAKLEAATHFIRDGIPYIATNPDKVCPTERGPIPDCGATAALLYEATGHTPKYIGKPHPEMIQMGMTRLGADPAVTAMVGDRLYTDVRMAHNAGIAAVLVLSGETQRADLPDAEDRPDLVIDNLAELQRTLESADS